MADLSVYRNYGQELEEKLRLKTHPLAVKFLEKEEDIPKGAIRPRRDWGYHLSQCQVFNISRRQGTAIAMLIEDMWCFEPVVGYGLGEPPQEFLDGYNRFPEDVETLEAGAAYAHSYPCLPLRKYIGIVSESLTTTTFEPGLVMIYCDTLQLNLLLLGREFRALKPSYKDSGDIRCRLSSHAACVYSTVPIMEGADYQIAVPCRGDHYYAMTPDGEIVFTVARDKLEDLMVGIKHLYEHGFGFPMAYTIKPEYDFRLPSYRTIGHKMGYM